jgi:hypothetical protein
LVTWLVLIGGTVLYLVLGAAIDSIFPGADLLGLNFQAIIFSTLCLIAVLWAAVKLELFD